MSVFPLTSVYSYLNEKGFEHIRDETDGLYTPDGSKRDQTLRRGRIILFLEEKGLLTDFIEKYWSEGKSPKGRYNINYCRNYYCRILSTISNFPVNKKNNKGKNKKNVVLTKEQKQQDDKKHPESKNIEMSKYLDQTISLLVRFLDEILPDIADDWWRKTVLSKLTDLQLRNVRNKKITSLKGFDLAALLRVFDQNWYEISPRFNFEKQERNILKEMQSLRDRWAHKPDEGYKADDIHRDLDTLQRFLRMINSDLELIDELQKKKRNIY
jgi:hypothetical protein